VRRINLLPSSRKRDGDGILARLDFLRNLPPRTWTVALAGIAAGIAVLLVVTVSSERSTVLSRTEIAQAQLDSLRPVVVEVEDLRHLKEILDSKMDVVDKLIIGRLCWARKLNQLAAVLDRDETIKQKVWLTSIDLVDRRTVETRVIEKKGQGGQIREEVTRVPVMIKVLELTGVIETETAAGIVSDLMRLIREDEAFFDAFSKIELDNIGSTRAKASEGKSFKLSLLMKREGARGD
jgi:Tfp pilus assembly protein PilN